MKANVIIKKAEYFIKYAENAARNGENVSSSKKNLILTKLGSLFIEGIPFEGEFKKVYEGVDKVNNLK